MIGDDLLPWLREVQHQRIPVIMVSQTLRGTVDLHRFRRQVALEGLGIMSGKNMSYECATVKLMWALTQAKTPLRLRELMERSLVGELDD